MGYYDYIRRIRSQAKSEDSAVKKTVTHVCHATRRACPYDANDILNPQVDRVCGGSCFLPLESDRTAWHSIIDSVVAGTCDNRVMQLVSSHTPPVLARVIDDEFGMSEDLPVYMSTSDIVKSLTGKHRVSPDEAKKLVDGIFDPIAVFRSSTHPHNAVVALVEIRDESTGTDSVVPVWYARNMGHIAVNRVTSIYGKPISQICSWETMDRNSVYANMKKIGRYPAIRRALIARGGKDGHGQFGFLTEKDFSEGTSDSISNNSELVHGAEDGVDP